MDVQVHVVDLVMKPLDEVFDAIIDPTKLTEFFPSAASGPLVAGETVAWTLADVGALISPRILTVEPNRLISFEWDASGQNARVNIKLSPHNEDTTRITIVEDGWPMNAEGVIRGLRQTQGWMDFICCMKAYLQFDVNLREGRTRDLH